MWGGFFFFASLADIPSWSRSHRVTVLFSSLLSCRSAESCCFCPIRLNYTASRQQGGRWGVLFWMCACVHFTSLVPLSTSHCCALPRSAAPRQQEACTAQRGTAPPVETCFSKHPQDSSTTHSYKHTHTNLMEHSSHPSATALIIHYDISLFYMDSLSSLTCAPPPSLYLSWILLQKQRSSSETLGLLTSFKA